MRNIFLLLCLFAIGAFSCSLAKTLPELDGKARSLAKTLPELDGKALATIREGMSEKEVLGILGPPDEIRKIPEDRLLDGTRIASSANPDNEEVYRWAYGVRGKDTFARIGIVSFDVNRRVIWSSSPVYGFKNFGNKEIAFSEHGIPSPEKLFCRLGQIKFRKAEGETVRYYTAKVTLTNNGDSEYLLKFDTVSIHRLVIVEIYDANKKLIFQDNHMLYHSPYGSESVLQILPGQSATESTNVSPSHYFGPLPPGIYYIRACFPFDIMEWKYCPSNLVPFEVPPFPHKK